MCFVIKRVKEKGLKKGISVNPLLFQSGEIGHTPERESNFILSFRLKLKECVPFGANSDTDRLEIDGGKIFKLSPFEALLKKGK